MEIAESLESRNPLPQLQQLQPGEGTTFLRTCFNGLNLLTGVGILSISYAFAQGGWLSLLLFASVAALFCYTGILLQRCMKENESIRSYPDIGGYAFGNIGRVIISIFLYVELYLVAVELLILEGDNLDKMFPNIELNFGELNIKGKQAFVVLASLLVLPTTWLRNLGVLAYLSAGGVLISSILVICVVLVGAIDGVGFQERGMLLNLRRLPAIISMFAFSFCGHAVFPTLRNSMQNKAQFSKVLIVCFIVSTFNYGLMGVIGCLMYGEDLKSQVTLNLPLKSISTKIALVTTIIIPLTKYALVATPIATVIEERAHVQNRLLSILIRSILVISTVFIALAIPFFDYVMELIGALFGVTTSTIVPCICYLKIDKSTRKFGRQLIIIIAILVSSSIIVVVGTFSAIKQIVSHI